MVLQELWNEKSVIMDHWNYICTRFFSSHFNQSFQYKSSNREIFSSLSDIWPASLFLSCGQPPASFAISYFVSIAWNNTNNSSFFNIHPALLILFFCLNVYTFSMARKNANWKWPRFAISFISCVLDFMPWRYFKKFRNDFAAGPSELKMNIWIILSRCALEWTYIAFYGRPIKFYMFCWHYFFIFKGKTCRAVFIHLQKLQKADIVL